MAGLDPAKVPSFRLDFVVAFAAGRQAHADRFPVIDAAALPFMLSNAQGISALDAWHRNYAKTEMKDVKFCLAFIHAPSGLHMSDKKVVLPDDVKGTKIRPAMATLFEAWLVCDDEEHLAAVGEHGDTPAGVDGGDGRSRVELDAAGTFVESVEVSADFSVVNPVRGVSNTVSVNFRRGESAPKLLILARAADGGIQRLDSAMNRK